MSNTEEPESSKRMCCLPSGELLDMGELRPVLDICGKEMLRLRKQESELLWTRMEAHFAYFPGVYVPGQCSLASRGRSGS